MTGSPFDPGQDTTRLVVMQLLDRREADMQADYLAMLDANTPPDFTQVAWATFKPRFTMENDGRMDVEVRRGFFIDRDNGDLTPQQMAFAVMRDTMG